MKIVIVDDSKIILEVAKDIILESDLDLELETFIDPIKALDFIENHDVQIVISDLIMPKLKGTDILRKIKNDEKLKSIKVLILTSITEEDILSECFELGAFDYITKPFSNCEFIARIKNVMKEIELMNKLAVKLSEVEKNHKKILESNKKLKITQAQLVQREQMAGIGQLAAGVAHELNNPLGFVVSNFTILKDYTNVLLELLTKYEKTSDFLDDEVINAINAYKKEKDFEFIIEDIYELLSDTKSGLDRAKEIVKSLRSFSRIDTLKEYSEYDVNEGIRETLIIAKNEYKYIAKINLNLVDIPTIMAFSGEINQVILNVIMNAVHAIKDTNQDNGEIGIQTSHIDGKVIIEISDNGTGIEEETIKKIFNPFFTTKEVGEGTGLGLSICYDIVVNKHEGEMNVESSLGEGTKFIIELPIKHIDDEIK